MLRTRSRLLLAMRPRYNIGGTRSAALLAQVDEATRQSVAVDILSICARRFRARFARQCRANGRRVMHYSSARRSRATSERDDWGGDAFPKAVEDPQC